MAHEINDRIEIGRDNAILLLAAAQELGLDAAVVETTSDGYFRVPQEVVDKAGLDGRKAPSEKAVDKAREAVLGGDGEVLGDPTVNAPEPGSVEPESSKAAFSDDSPGKQAPTRRGRKSVPAKRTAAKKAAAPNQKSE